MLHRDPGSRSFLRTSVCFATALAAGACALALSAPARAESGGTLADLTATTVVIDRAEDRQDATYRDWISKSDCDENVKITFTITAKSGMKLDPTKNMQVWVGPQGQSCIPVAARDGGAGSDNNCIKLGEVQVIDTLQFTFTADEIANALDDVTDCEATSATPRAMTVAFIEVVIGDSAVDATNYTVWPTTIALRAPDPPAVKSVTVGEGAITVTHAGLPTTDQKNTLEFALFCDPTNGAASASAAGCDCGGTPGATDSSGGSGGSGGTNPGPPPLAAGGGGSGGSGGTGGTTTDPTACMDKEIVVTECQSCMTGFTPTELLANGKYACGTASGVESADIKFNDLTNGTAHAVAFAVVDKVGNVSKLSGLKCAVPAEATDFYESYQARGGKAGGGCSMRAGSTNASRFAPYGAAAALVLLGVRRRSRRKRHARSGEVGQ